MGESIANEREVLEPDLEVAPSSDAASAPRSKLLGAELAHARREAGLTQRELADRLGVRLWMVDQWEAGAKAIPHETLELISDAIGTPTAARIVGRDTDLGHRPAAQTLLGSGNAMNDIPPRRLTAQEIRDAELPKSLRGYEEGATRRLLGDVAAAYERSVNQCDELRRQLEEQESARIDPEEHEFLEAERDELRERVDQLTKSAKSGVNTDAIVSERDAVAAERDSLLAERDGLLAERDELRKRADELSAELSERERAATPAGEPDELRRRVEELEQTLAGYTDSEQALTRALVAASRAGEELVKEAEAEAQAILVDARRAAEEIEREIDDRRNSFETERAALVEGLKHEALAAARDDLEALGRAAKPVLEALAVLDERLRAIVPSEPEETAPAELLEDLKAAPPARKSAATAEADRA